MFIKSLTISSKNGIIRKLEFCQGMNLIIDNTPLTDDLKSTGNNVGKTTVLKLIYYCLGGEGKDIYTDEENKSSVYEDVKQFLLENEIIITLILCKNLKDSKSENVVIERNFLSRKESILKINGKDIKKKDLDSKLSKMIFPEKKADKPTFKQLISHNVRYKDNSINRTLKTLDSFSTDVEYETLYLHLLGCEFDEGEKKRLLTSKIKQEKEFKDRIEKTREKSSYESSLKIIELEIENLNNKKLNLNINKNFEKDLNDLNILKYKINKSSSKITKLELRRDIILDAKKEMKEKICNIDFMQLEILYKEAKSFIPELHKTFEDLVSYHNEMILEKENFITKELPFLNRDIDDEKHNLNLLLAKEKSLSEKIEKSDSFSDLEDIIMELNEKYRLKGEYENILFQIHETEDNLNQLENELQGIDNYLYSEEFKSKLDKQIDKFNHYFSEISEELYGEKYILNCKLEKNTKLNKFVYKFNTFNSNMSTGKKQGEILCFDLAYILFADNGHIPCLHFLLNDKKELMHDNQLVEVANFIKDKNIQLIISILKDKLPQGLLSTSNVVVELSQNDKLFKF